MKVLRWLGLVVLAGWVGASPGPAEGAGAVVTDIRVGERDSSVTRFVLEVDRPVAVNLFNLDNPERLVVDLPEVGWRLPARALPRNVGALARVRYGLFRPGNSRLVIDLARPARVEKAWFLPPTDGTPFRLVVDLARTGRETFARLVDAPPMRVEAAVAAYPKTEAPESDLRTAAVEVPSKPLVRSAREEARKPRPGYRLTSNGYETALRLAPPKPVDRREARRLVIVIDPGHGGADPGTIGVSGIYEKHITLAVGRELKRALEATGRYKAVMTRDRDIFIALKNRVAMARRAGADLFVSLHADSIKDRSVRGASVYTLSETASDKEAAALAEKENKSDLIAGLDLSHENLDVTNILIDLAQRESMNQSAKFANLLVGNLRDVTPVLRRTHRFAGFRVLKAPDVPSVLVEMGFLSNGRDEKNLRSKAFRRRMAQAITEAVDRYFSRTESASR